MKPGTLYITAIFFLVFAASCEKSRDPNSYFSDEKQNAILWQSVHYSSKLPPQGTHETKFDTSFNWYYDRAVMEYDIRALTPDSSDGFYFLMTRKARSIWPAREAIGGRLKFDSNDSLTFYDEIFRTWKMAEDSLNTRAFELFDLMVEGKDLTPYRSKFKGDRYIEFPDDRSYFDSKTRRWRDRFVESR